ncbi:MAG: hypothetical protein Q9216_002414 [Gyalolechia sp. 2 TL-2023]
MATGVNRDPNDPTFPTLPIEIREEILHHLLVEPAPISIINPGNLDAASEDDVLKLLRPMNFAPEACRIFYRHNVFEVTENCLESFLNYNPTTPAEAMDKEHTNPKNHVRHLAVTMQPHLYALDHNPSPVIRNLLDCSGLEKLKIRLLALYEGLCEFDMTFIQIAGVCAELGDKLGAEGFEVRAEYLYGKRTWTLADFKSGQPPQGWP